MRNFKNIKPRGEHKEHNHGACVRPVLFLKVKKEKAPLQLSPLGRGRGWRQWDGINLLVRRLMPPPRIPRTPSKVSSANRTTTNTSGVSRHQKALSPSYPTFSPSGRAGERLLIELGREFLHCAVERLLFHFSLFLLKGGASHKARLAAPIRPFHHAKGQ